MDSSEASFSFTTKLNGDLFTIRGGTFGEFAANVGTVLENAQTVADKLAQVQAIGAAAPLVNAVVPVAPPPPAAAAGWGAPPAQAPAPAFAPPPAAFAQAAVPRCNHGERKPVSKTGAKGLWKAWFCPTDQHASDKCDPIWVSQKDDPTGWANFPV